MGRECKLVTGLKKVPLKVVGVDVGVNWGIAFNKDEYEQHKSKNTLDFYVKARDFIDLYKPDVVVCAYPTARVSVIASQNRKIGALEVICQKRDIRLELVNDAHSQKVVLGKRRKAQAKRTPEEWTEVTDRYGISSDDSDAGDAMMFRECWIIENY